MKRCGLDSNKVSKISNFAEEKTDLSPSVRTCMTIKYGSKISTFYKDESTHLRDL